ncbi:hypothetical protein, partial [Pseudomonas aeruginosa]|uniref:hypothetical protein n=1 Tax=Pseudomonas aeruginosa TaxID=287 RepID=UPI001ED993E3
YPPAHRHPARRIAASGYSPYPSIPITRRANSAPALSANAPVPHPADSRERLFALPERPITP